MSTEKEKPVINKTAIIITVIICVAAIVIFYMYFNLPRNDDYTKDSEIASLPPFTDSSTTPPTTQSPSSTPTPPDLTQEISDLKTNITQTEIMIDGKKNDEQTMKTLVDNSDLNPQWVSAISLQSLEDLKSQRINLQNNPNQWARDHLEEGTISDKEKQNTEVLYNYLILSKANIKAAQLLESARSNLNSLISTNDLVYYTTAQGTLRNIELLYW